ncbi:MAG: hypothetical protein V3U73_07470 [bacterium]
MARAILLNEFDPNRRNLLRSKLERQGYRVWSTSHLGEVIPILHDVAIDLMILDGDKYKIVELVEFASRWRGVLTLFQKRCSELSQDLRKWTAKKLICKCENGDNILRAVSALLGESELKDKIEARQDC